MLKSRCYLYIGTRWLARDATLSLVPGIKKCIAVSLLNSVVFHLTIVDIAVWLNHRINSIVCFFRALVNLETLVNTLRVESSIYMLPRTKAVAQYLFLLLRLVL